MVSKKKLIITLTSVAVLAVIILFLGVRFYSLYAGKTNTETDKFFFSVVYLQILLVITLGFVVGRNIVKLVFDRRNKVLGAKLRTRLLLALVGITLIPTFLLYIFASGLLDKAFEGWFSNKIESAIDASVLLGRKAFLELKSQVTRSSDELVKKLADKKDLFILEDSLDEKTDDKSDEKSVKKIRLNNEEVLTDILEQFRKDKGFYRISLLVRTGRSKKVKTLIEVTHPTSTVSEFKEPEIPDNIINNAFLGTGQIISDLQSSGQFIRAILPIESNTSERITQDKFVLLLSYRIDPELADAFLAVQDSYNDIGQLKLYRKPIQTSYGITLILVTMCVMFAAVWLAFYISRYITKPIEELALATEQVSKGNYELQLKSRGNDEISYLIRSFNQMTYDLGSSQKIAKERQILINTVLKHVTVGVIQVAKDETVITINPLAQKIYGLSDKLESYQGKALNSIFNNSDYENLHSVIESIKILRNDVVIEKDIKVVANGRELLLVCTAGKIYNNRIDDDSIENRSEEWKDIFIILKDITEVTKAQAMSAWREVARRIAHEIKNPLTPIQLSAERLQKIFEGLESSKVISDTSISNSLSESVKHIVDNVSSIKRLANEFSNFARMPTAVLNLENINQLLSEVIATFSEQYPQLTFLFLPEDNLPLVNIDREQIRRVFINLIDNATSAVSGNQDENGKIVVKTSLIKNKNDKEKNKTVTKNISEKERTVTIEISDNGKGIKQEDKYRIFEPYFTTKKGGTGLGLAIVSSVINEHKGEIKVFDNFPRGVRFVVEI